MPRRSARLRAPARPGLRDYEDAVQAVAALRAGSTWLVTRNPRDYKGAPVEIRSAGEVLALVA
jgi:hypothetical protein